MSTSEQMTPLKSIYAGETFYTSDFGILIHSDLFTAMQDIKSESVDLIFADPPYFLSGNGTTCHSGKRASVNKGEWDASCTLQQKHEFNKRWIKECYRVLKPSGTIFVSGTFHNIYSVGMALEENNFKIINNITWEKTNPPPNLSCKCFTHSTETVLWARKNIKEAKPLFNYQKMKEKNEGKQMKDVWSGSLTPAREKQQGNHPTQKPLYLLDRIIEAAAAENYIVLDPFVGSGTTAVSAANHNCTFIGIDISAEYLEIAQKRLTSETIKSQTENTTREDASASSLVSLWIVYFLLVITNMALAKNHLGF